MAAAGYSGTPLLKKLGIKENMRVMLIHTPENYFELIEKDIQQKAAGSVKRVFTYRDVNWLSEKGQSPYYILDLQEIKTTWHPIENIGGAGGGY